MIIVLVSAITWSSSLHSEFTGYDDIKLIVNNEIIKSDFSRILKFFWNSFSSSFNTAWTNEQTVIHRPLEQYGSAIGYKLWGTSAWHFHFFFNYLIHILNSLLIYFICSKVTNKKLLSFITVLIWTVHPLHNEAINMLTSGVGFLWAHFFALLGVYLALLDPSSLPKVKAGLSSAILAIALGLCLLLGYMGSEMTIISPLIITLILFTGKHKARINKSLVAFASLFFYLIHRSNIGCTKSQLLDTDFIERTFVLAPQILIHHLRLFFFPAKLTIDQQHNIWLENAFSPFHLFCLFTALALVFALFYFRKSKIISGSLLLTALSIGLSLNIIPVYCLARERYTYIFSFGLILALVFLVNKYFKANTTILIIILVLALGSRSWLRNLDWQNGEKFWTQTIESIDDIGAKQVWRYQLLQYYKNPASKNFKANETIQDQVIKDFDSFVFSNELEKKITIDKYHSDNPDTYIKDKYSYNGPRSIASGILSKAMYIKQYHNKKGLIEHLNLAYLYDPYNMQTKLQLYIHLDDPKFKQLFLEELKVDAAKNPYSAKLLLELLHHENNPVLYELAKKYYELYPKVQIIQAYYFDATLRAKKYPETYEVALKLSKKYHEDPRYDEFIEKYEKLLNQIIK